MKKYLIAAFMFMLIACGAQTKIESTPQPDLLTKRQIAQGELIGFISETGAHVWRGVPYAADTSGKNRWRAPRPTPKWNAAREALDFAPACAQIATPFTPIASFTNWTLEGSEDCLVFDIYAPPQAQGQNLPVMMWIHGGSNVSGASQLYVGDQLAVNENVIILSVQYRLGPLGWFSHEALRKTAATPLDKAANFGLLDQIAALTWIKDNIAAFGGDPNNITIFGESAGGHNVAALLASPLAKGMFHKAIIQSGSFDSTAIANAENKDSPLPNPSAKIAARLGIENFHTASLEQVFAAFDLDGGGYMDLPRMIEDGVSLPAGSMIDAFKNINSFNAVPVMTGTNRDELKLFFLFNEDLVKKSFGMLFKARDQALYDAASDYSARNWRIGAVDKPAALMNAAGHKPVYGYRFDWDEGGKFLTTDLSKLLGAAHSLEIPFVFNRFKLLGDADRIMFKKNTLKSRDKLSRIMGSYWAEFARSGVPKTSGGPSWPPYRQNAAIMHFDSDNDGGVYIKNTAETPQRILQDLSQDRRLDNPQRCRILTGLSQIPKDQMTAAGQDFNCKT